jgi:uncharacterized RDD family membrane protein YckC
MEPKDELPPNETGGSSQVADGVTHQKEKPRKFPGCFKRLVAFVIDGMIIAGLSIVIFFPFSGFIDSLHQNAWLPAFLLGGVYFAVLESSIWKCQSIGKIIFSMKVNTVEGKPISPLVSFGRYVIIIFPFFQEDIGASLTSIIGLANIQIISIIYLIFVGVILSGNTFFMLFHPQRRGLHDVIFSTAVFPTKYEIQGKIKNFTLRPVLGGVGFLIIFGILFGSLLTNAARNPDFADIEQLNHRIQSATNYKGISASYSYKTFSKLKVDSPPNKPSFTIEVNIPVPYGKIDDGAFRESISKNMYPTVKRANANPKVETITLRFFARRYIGAFPMSKTYNIPKKISEIE